MSKKLKVLDLTGCVFLTRTPDFSNFLSLEILRLDWCIRLITIDCSIGELKHLKTLNIKGCRSLRKLPPEVGSLPSLQIVGYATSFEWQRSCLKKMKVMLWRRPMKTRLERQRKKGRDVLYEVVVLWLESKARDSAHV